MPVIINLERESVTDELNALIRDFEQNPQEKKEAIRQLFVRLVLVATAVPNTLFRNRFGRFRFLLNTKIDPSEWQAYDAFRRFLNSNITATDEDIDQGLQTIKSLAEKLDLFRFYDRVIGADFDPEHFVKRIPTRDVSNLTSSRYLISEVSGFRKDKAGNLFFLLKGYIIENMAEAIPLVIKENKYSKYFNDCKNLKEGDLIYINNFQVFKGKNGDYLMNSFDSLFILEPDLLLEATSVGECFQMNGASYESFFLSKLDSSVPGEAALKGSIVGMLLDEMFRTGFQYEIQFEEAVEKFKLWAARLGTDSVLKIKSSIVKEHLGNLKMLIRSESPKEVWIEPTYFSQDFGLQGRLDLLAMDGSRKDIVELKSGSPASPKFLAWPGQIMQVVAYDLLLSSTYPDEQVGSKSIFYSRAELDPYRIITSEHREKYGLSRLRNEIVRAMQQIAENDFSMFQKIADQGFLYVPKFHQEHLEEYQRRFQQDGQGELKTFRKDYFLEMVAFTMRELINAKVGTQPRLDKGDYQNGFASLWLNGFESKKHGQEVLPGVKLWDIDEKQGYLHFGIPEEISHPMRKGDLVVCWPLSGNEYHPLKQHILKGSIKSISTRQVTISLFNKQTDYKWIKDQSDSWCIEPDIFERNYWSTIACLYHVLDPEKKQLDLLTGAPAKKVERFNFQHPDLTPNQNKVILDSLNATNYYLLQGPPGTGKTSTFLTNYVNAVMEQSNDTMFILAFTNKAVDNICRGLRKNRYEYEFEFVRIGSKHVDDPNLVSEILKGGDPDGWGRQLRSQRIVVSTLSSFQNNMALLSSFWSFDQLIVDEASQITEANLGGVIVNFKKTVLIGDHKQLPPVITQSEEGCEVKSDSLKQIGLKDHQQSLFERVFEKALKGGDPVGTGQLTEQYRMNINILNLISNNYPKQITCGFEELSNPNSMVYRVPPEYVIFPLANLNTVFIDTSGSGNGKYNEHEADICKAIVRDLIQEAGILPNEIGIIAPFRAQVNLIRKKMKQVWLDAQEPLIVDTVERFQGDEKKIILFSTTVASKGMLSRMQSISNSQGIKTDRKLLVSASRAKEQLILLGSKEILGQSPFYAEVLNQINRNGKEFVGWDFLLIPEL